MTLFVRTKNALYEVDDFYVMTLIFIASYLLTTCGKKIFQKIVSYKKKRKIIADKIKVDKTRPRGGQGIDLDSINWRELEVIVEECLEEDKTYLLLNEKFKEVIKFIFKVKYQSDVVLTPALTRTIVRYFLRDTKPGMIKVSEIMVVFSNVKHFIIQATGAIIAGGITGLGVGLLKGTALTALIMTYTLTRTEINCERYFKEIPADRTGKEITVLLPEKKNNLIISNEFEKIARYVPSPNDDKIIDVKPGVKEKVQQYKKVKKPAKKVTFDEFRKKDPILSLYGDNLPEPVKQKKSYLRKGNVTKEMQKTWDAAEL